MSIIKSIQRNHFDMKEKRRWDKMYWFFDIHATVIKPNYQAGNIPTEFYPHALETLQLVSKLEDVTMILYTCSHPHEIEQYLEYFKSKDIHFSHTNKNPEVLTEADGYGCYDDKPYINVLFDDKAGFDGEEDWVKVKEFLEYKYGLKTYKLLTDSDINELSNELEVEEFGYWVQNYSKNWIEGEANYELKTLLLDARESLDKLETFMYKINVFE